jgi:tryptophan-rich sensory protein
MRNWLSLLMFLLLVMGGGILIGTQTLPGEWFASLAKPSFNPPGWVFAPVWTILYALIAVAGWLTWRREPAGAPMYAWAIQQALNFAWSPVFFAAHSIGLALAVILALLVAILAFIGMSWRVNRAAALLFIPYAAWVAFATLLNAAFYVLN